MKKYLCHVPTEQYGFISVELEGEAPDAVDAYKELQRAWGAGEGLSAKEWTGFLDTYVSTGKPPEGGLELWERMDVRQRDIVNEIKKTIKRNTK